MINLKTFKPINNHVLVKPIVENDKIKLSNGNFLYIDTSYEPEKHAPVVCEVVALPDELVFIKDRTDLMPWETSIEVDVGDTVYCSYLPIATALSHKVWSSAQNKLHTINGEKHVLIKYSDIFLSINNEKVTMCNGYALIENTSKEYREDVDKLTKIGLSAPDNPIRKNKTNFGIVRYIGNNVTAHLLNAYPVAGGCVNVGDYVCFDKYADIPLEYEMHQTFEKGKILFRIHQKDILLVIM